MTGLRETAQVLWKFGCSGTIGIIIIAKQRQKIDAVGPMLKQIDQVGFRINSSLINAALDLAGES